MIKIFVVALIAIVFVALSWSVSVTSDNVPTGITETPTVVVYDPVLVGTLVVSYYPLVMKNGQ